MTKVFKFATLPLLFTAAACSQATSEAEAVTTGAWSVDSDASELAYVTIKQGDIAEINSFETVTGSISAEGAAQITVDLSSVSTGVDIRDERMRDIFFVVADNPTATISATIDPAAFESLAVGESATTEVAGTVSIKGVEAPVFADVTVTRAGADRVLAVSDAPVIIDAGRFELTGGLAQLQELAGLDSITPVVPVTFSLAFER
ncbi:MAG: YceI family protein [Pseudomonadota bacterium]